MAVDMDAAILELRRRREEGHALGGPERIARQHARGLLTARERIDLLLDPGPRFEVTPIAGFGRVHGRPVAYHATDATVKGGAGNSRGQGRIVGELAKTAAMPFIELTQEGGGNIQALMGSRLARRAGGGGGSGMGKAMARPRRGLRFRVALGNLYGPPGVGLCDLSFMTKKTNASITSPTLNKAAMGEIVSEAELGSWEVHSKITGQIDVVGEDDADTIRLVREAFDYLPGNVFEEPPIRWSGDPIDRRDEALVSIIPDNVRRPYDMHRVVKCVVDDGVLFELTPHYGRGIITGLARMAGYPVGIIANHTLYQAGAIDNEAFVKAKRLTELCGTFHLPMIFFHDTPGVLTSLQQERNRLVTKGMDFMVAQAEADVPKVSIVVRKSYGLAYFVMNGSAPAHNFTFAWPTASIAFMAPEPAVRIAYRRQLAESSDPVELERTLGEEWRREAEPWQGAKMAGLDDVIDPRDTRRIIIQSLEFGMGAAKAAQRRWPPQTVTAHP